MRGNTQAMCPYCGCLDLHVEADPPLEEDGDKGTLICRYCDCDFDVTLHVERSFTTTAKRRCT